MQFEDGCTCDHGGGQEKDTNVESGMQCRVAEQVTQQSNAGAGGAERKVEFFAGAARDANQQNEDGRDDQINRDEGNCG